MTQTEQVIKAMEECGGFATFAQLYGKVKTLKWGTKTPQESIRRIVQNDRYFFKIEPGLWALKSRKDKLPKHLLPAGAKSPGDAEQRGHYYYQGLLLQLGKLRNLETFAPNQDRNKKFLNTNLGSLRTLSSIYEFGYRELVRHARTVDVSWFNSRKMPHSFFEVEHSTQMDKSLIKFSELSDFNARFFIVSHKSRKKEFQGKMGWRIFEDIKKRVRFLDYEELISETVITPNQKKSVFS